MEKPRYFRKAKPGTDVGRACKIEGCDEKARQKGYCPAHNQRIQKYGDPHFVQHQRKYGAIV